MKICNKKYFYIVISLLIFNNQIFAGLADALELASLLKKAVPIHIPKVDNDKPVPLTDKEKQKALADMNLLLRYIDTHGGMLDIDHVVKYIKLAGILLPNSKDSIVLQKLKEWKNKAQEGDEYRSSGDEGLEEEIEKIKTIIEQSKQKAK